MTEQREGATSGPHYRVTARCGIAEARSGVRYNGGALVGFGYMIYRDEQGRITSISEPEYTGAVMHVGEDVAPQQSLMVTALTTAISGRTTRLTNTGSALQNVTQPYPNTKQ